MRSFVIAENQSYATPVQSTQANTVIKDVPPLSEGDSVPGLHSTLTVQDKATRAQAIQLQYLSRLDSDPGGCVVLNEFSRKIKRSR